MKKETIVRNTMREFKEGKLRSSSGEKVTSRKQAIAIALSKSGQSKFAAGGMVGQNLVFDRWDEKLEGRIIEITDSGDYIVSSGSRTILVSPDDIISYGDMKPKKRFSFFKDGGTTSSETILWAVKVGEPDWKEVLITNNPDKIDEARKWASENGFDRFRVASVDMSSRPDFTKTFKDGGDVMKYDWASMWKKPSKSSRVMIGDVVFQKHSDQPYKIIELLDDQYTVAKIVNNEETEWKTFNKDFYEHRMFEKRN